MIFERLERHPLVRPRRYRRQYADHAGPRLLHGQSWFDLRQYRLNPPFGANIHWSRLVDLPIAGLILGLRPFLGGAGAERWAVAIAPLLPYLLLLFSLGLTARRLIDPRAYPLAFLAMFFAGSTNGMFMPERIDHHGWQLALLALRDLRDCRSQAGTRRADARHFQRAVARDRTGDDHLSRARRRGDGAVLGDDAEERERLRAYAVSLGGGTALAFLVFASYDNRHAGMRRFVAGVAVGRADRRRADVRARVAVAGGLEAAAGAGASWPGSSSPAFHAFTWPHCLQRLEGVSPEVERLWLSHVKEARPVYRHGWRIATLIVALAGHRSRSAGGC